MRLDITGRHVDVTPYLRQLITNRLKTLERVLNDAAVSAQVIVSREKYRHRVEMVIHARGDHTLTGLGEGNSWPLAIRQASQKIEQQAKKLKGKWEDRKRKGAGRRGARPQDAPPAKGHPRHPRRRGSSARPGMPSNRCRSKMRPCAWRTAPTPSSCSATPTTTRLSILYRRKDGNLGLIEPE